VLGSEPGWPDTLGATQTTPAASSARAGALRNTLRDIMKLPACMEINS
jgi:hypothetical protein